MAERRMFAKTIIDSDAFLDMPTSTQNLYFHLAMRADDDGFINNPKKIARMVSASDDDLKILLGKHFLIGFETGVVVIKHWRLHNYIARDRYKETVYKEEFSRLALKENNSYTVKTDLQILTGQQCIQTVDKPYTECIQDVDTLETQVRLGKERLGKEREEKESLPSKPRSVYSPTDETVSTRFERHRAAWNYADLPGGRFSMLNMNSDDVSAVKTIYGAYSDDEIEQAIQNYKTVISGPEYDLPEKYQYGTFLAFLKKGVVQYVDSAKPLEKKKVKPIEKPEPERRPGELVFQEKKCKCCGKTWNTTQGACPRCMYEDGDIDEHKEWYKQRFGTLLPEMQ